MRRNLAHVLLAATSCLAFFVGDARAEAEFLMCNESGFCTAVPPQIWFGVVLLSQFDRELKLGSEGFGPNGFIRKTVETILGDLTRGGGLGNNNDVVKMFKTFDNDLKNGLGPNNDIRKVLGDVLGLRW